MRILVYSRSFAPAIGGMERLMETLAAEFARQGHEVTVATETPGQGDMPFRVVRRPTFRDYLRLARSADVILSAPLSLRRLPAQLLSRRRIVVTHPILWWHRGVLAFTTFLKRRAVRLVTSVVPSRFMASHFPAATVIGNPYEAETFVSPPQGSPRAGVLFVGRLTPEKGCHLLFEALGQLSADLPDTRITVVGDGPERNSLEHLAASLGIAERVDFRGELTGVALAGAMQAHRVMVVPTIWEEAFGIVALEGLACGCRMVVAESGGLPEAVGGHALTFPRGDVAALADCLDRALGPQDTPPSPEAVALHLAQFTPERIAARYLAVLGAP